MADLNIGEQQGGALGGGGGSAVRIPIVTSVSAPLKDAPPVSRWRGSGIPPTEPVQTQGIFEGIEGAGEKLGKIFAAQGANQRALQANKLVSDFDLADTEARATAQTTGSYMGTDQNNMVSLYRQSTDKTIQGILNDPANKGLLADPQTASQIQSRIYAAQNKGIGDMAVSMAKSAMVDQEAQLKSQTHTQAITAGADYSIAPDGSIVDGPKAQQARQDVSNLLDTVKGHLPGEKAADLQAFNLDVASQRAQSIAQNSANQPFLLDKFIKSQPAGTFTPEQMNHFSEMQRSAIKAPYDNVMAAHDAKAAGAIMQLNQMQDKHDPNLPAQAYQAQIAGLINEEQARGYVGAGYRRPQAPSAPGIVDQYMSDIRNNPFKYSSQDLAAIPADDISPQDRRSLQAALHDGQRDAQKPMNAEYVNSREAIREALTPSINVNPEATKLKIDAALSDLEVGMKNAGTPAGFEKAQDVIDARNKIIQSYAPKAGVRKPLPHVVIGPNAIPPGVAAAIAAKARGAGFDGSVGE